MWIKHITKNKVFKNFIRQIWQDLQMLGNSFCEFGLVSTNRFLNQNVHLFEKSLLKIMAQL